MTEPRRAEKRPRAAPPRMGSLIAVGFLALVLVGSLQALVPLFVLPIYLALSGLTYRIYWSDLQAARVNVRRVHEAWLLLANTLGGWPGGLLAHDLLRHKNHRREFQRGFRRSVGFNVLALGAYLAARHILG